MFKIKKKKKKIEEKKYEPIKGRIYDPIKEDLEAVFSNCYCYSNVTFASDNVKWEYALKFEGKIKSSEINKIQKFIFNKYELVDYEFRPDLCGTAIWFVFNILKDGARIGYNKVEK